jgi:hypothetical protein
MANANRSVHPNALPNYQNAVLPREKLEKYVLDPTNPVGKNKAVVFKSVLAFDPSNWDVLAKIIIDQLPYYEALLGRKDNYGQRYNVTMPITGPNGRTADVLTAWIIDIGEDYPRFITAYLE